jgi:hypothetical protein
MGLLHLDAANGICYSSGIGDGDGDGYLFLD